MGEGGGDFRLGRGELSPFFASIFPLFPQKRLILRLERLEQDMCDVTLSQSSRLKIGNRTILGS